jgi:AbrB family looped-hinge helix DNA binding protein
MAKITTYNADDIFEDIPGDEENVLMTIPPEILEQMGWKAGDTLVIQSEDGKISISKKETNGQE